MFNSVLSFLGWLSIHTQYACLDGMLLRQPHLQPRDMMLNDMVTFIDSLAPAVAHIVAYVQQRSLYNARQVRT